MTNRSIINSKTIRLTAGLLTFALGVSVLSAPVFAHGVPFYGPGGFYGYSPYHHPFYPPPRRMNDFDRTLAVIGTVGAVAAAANARNYHYYRRPPTVIVTQPRPPIVIAQPNPIVIERPVVVERLAPVAPVQEGSYSPRLGAWFRIENMQIPGHTFTAARLTSEPLPDSPLNRLGLRRGDVITRLNDNPANVLTELDRHAGNTSIRYIKTGTTRVLLGNVFIPAQVDGQNGYLAP